MINLWKIIWQRCVLWKADSVPPCSVRSTFFSLRLHVLYGGMWQVVPTSVSRWRETNFIITCNPVPSTSTNVCTHQIFFFMGAILREWPFTVTAWSKAWTVFVHSNARIVASNPTQGMDVCVRLFCVCVVLCARSGLAAGWSPVQGVLPTVYNIKKMKRRQRSNKRTTEP
jgi:hypothetical protein